MVSGTKLTLLSLRHVSCSMGSRDNRRISSFKDHYSSRPASPLFPGKCLHCSDTVFVDHKQDGVLRCQPPGNETLSGIMPVFFFSSFFFPQDI